MTNDFKLITQTIIDIIEWQLVRDKKRLGEKDVAHKLKEIDLLRDLLLGDDDDQSDA